MNRKATINIRQNSYEIEFPNIGQIKDIELMKAFLSNGRYGALVEASTLDSGFTLDFIDTQSYLEVLRPEIKKAYRVESLRDLSIEDSIELIGVFKKQLLPFIQKWREIIDKGYKDMLKKEAQDAKQNG